jgi:hypothetical protein
MFKELLQQEVGAFATFFFNHGGQSVRPFTGLYGIQVE